MQAGATATRGCSNVSFELASVALQRAQVVSLEIMAVIREFPRRKHHGDGRPLWNSLVHSSPSTSIGSVDRIRLPSFIDTNLVKRFSRCNGVFLAVSHRLKRHFLSVTNAGIGN